MIEPEHRCGTAVIGGRTFGPTDGCQLVWTIDLGYEEIDVIMIGPTPEDDWQRWTVLLEGAGPATNHAEFEPALAHALALVSQTEALKDALFSDPAKVQP